MNKHLLLTCLILASFIIYFLYYFIQFSDNKLHLVFCNVGQGDSIFIRTARGTDILIDGGPSEQVLDCLTKHMPFWDRSIELLVSTHPHSDHLTGLDEVLNRYDVSSVATEEVNSNSEVFKQFKKEILAKKLKVNYLYSGDVYRTKDGLILKVLAPSKEDLHSGASNLSENSEQIPVEILIKYQKFSAFLTSDSQSAYLDNIIGQDNISGINVLQIPHHGSKYGIDEITLEKINPNLAIISVGKNNKYGHPASSVLGLLHNLNIKTLRTDEKGDIEIISDGQTWQYEQ